MGDERTDRERFADLVDGVEPLADRDRVPRGSPTRRPGGADPGRSEGPVAFEYPRPDEPRLAHVPGLDRASFRRLRSGKWRPDRRVDLHGDEVLVARRNVTDALLEAVVVGDRCVLVIHGRGLHSPGQPVLRLELPLWLREPPLGPLVLAFAPARAADGGDGATYVLLRRSRG